MYLGVYVGLGLGYSLLVFMRSWSNALGGFHARYGLAVSSCVHHFRMSRHTGSISWYDTECHCDQLACQCL